jgi:hypothetical protein
MVRRGEFGPSKTTAPSYVGAYNGQIGSFGYLAVSS